MRPAKTQFNQSVELEITYAQQLNYNPPKGINILWYDRKNTEKAANRVNATFVSSSIASDINQQKYIHDINAELALLGKFVKKDHLKKSDEPNLVRNPTVKTESILDTSIFKGERDRILSRAKDRHTVNIEGKDGFYKADFGQITE